MNFYYRSEFPEIDTSDPKDYPLSYSENRADQLSYVPVARIVANFIASGRSVSSLRSTLSAESGSVSETISEAFDHEMTVFDRNPYGPDIAEVSMAQKSLEAKAKKFESDSKKVESVIKASKGSGETAAIGVPGSDV